MKTVFRYLTPARTLVLALAYSTLFVISLKLAYELRFDFNIPAEFNERFLNQVLWIVPLKLGLLLTFGQFGGLLSYFRLPDLSRIFFALFIASIGLLIAFYFGDRNQFVPRSVILGDFLFSIIFITGFRMTLRIVRERYMVGQTGSEKKLKRTGIIGAGDAGAQIAADLLAHPRHGMRPVCFLDDDPEKLKRHIHGISVVDKTNGLREAKTKYGLEKVIIAMPSASARVITDIVRQARDLGLEAEMVPSLEQLATGKVKANQIRPVDIQDLLGREQVELETEKIRRMIQGRVVLVTGAGGSIGSELCRQIAQNNPARLLMVEQNEYALFQIENELSEKGYDSISVALIADILDTKRIHAIFNRYQPHLVFHAAAHKHVHLMERQPGEALKNNSVGTEQLANISAQMGVQKFVLISTDKAINPTSVMGASKRLAEIYLQAKQKENGTLTRFMAVRFGNVLGSSGSVVPIFRNQIQKGGPVRVTHPDVTRYFMTIPEAVGLVLQAATQGDGGEIFVLDMGKPIKIVDLARQMIELSGYRPDIDIEIEYIGLRPGEKLFEELQHDTEDHQETEHPRIRRYCSEPSEAVVVREFLRNIEDDILHLDRNGIKEKLKTFIPEYRAFLD